jgi:hypothetical protein
MDRLTGDSLFQTCDPVQTIDEAMRPILTPLLPVKGLRRDGSGNLTDDAYKTVLDGIQSLGIQVNQAASQTAILQEARSVLCKLFAQYEFFLKAFNTSVARSEELRPEIATAMRERLQQMMDVLSIARRVIQDGGSKTTEGFVSRADFLKQLEAFEDIQATIQAYQKRLATTNARTLHMRALEDSEEKNRFASRQLALYSFMNIVATGLLFYVMAS